MPTILVDFSRSRRLDLRAAPIKKMQMEPGGGGAHPPGRVPATTDLSALRGQSLLLLLDGDNLDISAKGLGLKVRYDGLLTTLQDEASELDAVAIITSNVDDHRREDALANCGLRVVSIPREIVVERGEARKVANADSDLAFELGKSASVADYSAVCLGTGDGDLAVSCLRGWRRTCGEVAAVHTVSIAGATSARLRRRDLFDSSILLGMDLLVSISVDRQQTPLILGGSNGRNASVVA